MRPFSINSRHRVLHRLTSANLVFRALKQPSLESGSKSKSAPPNKTARQVQYANQHLIKQEHMYKRGKQHGFVWKLGTQYMEYIAICEKSGWTSEPTTRCSCFFPSLVIIFRQTHWFLGCNVLTHRYFFSKAGHVGFSSDVWRNSSWT